MSVNFYMSIEFTGQKFCVQVLCQPKTGNGFAQSVLWRIRKPIGSVKVKVWTVILGTLIYDSQCNTFVRITVRSKH